MNVIGAARILDASMRWRIRQWAAAAVKYIGCDIRSVIAG